MDAMDQTSPDHQHHEHHMEEPSVQAGQSGHDMPMHHHGAADSSSALDISAMLLFFLVAGFLFARGLGRKLPLAGLSERRLNLFKIPGLRRIVKFRYFSFFIRLIPALFLLLVIASGLFGSPDAGFAAGFTWLFWWTALIFMVALGGKIFCAMCPWDFFANFFQFGFGSKEKISTVGLNLGWPKALSNIYPATVFFILITWLELGFDITRNSHATAILALSILSIAVASALIFKRRGFCRFACPVGRIGGLYAEIAPLELRTEDPAVCDACDTKDCVKGTDHSSACPTWQVPYQLQQNTYCTLCTECVRSCPKDNLAFKARPIASDMGNIGESRRDEAVLVVVMLVLSYFHGITMTPHWFAMTDYISGHYGLSYMGAFSVLMAVLLAAAFAFFKGCEAFLNKKLGRKHPGYILAYALIPMALGYHLGHNSMHFFSEIPRLVPLMGDPFGFGWNLFGWAAYEPVPLIETGALKYVQLACIAIGFYYALKILRLRIEMVSEEKAGRGHVFFFGYGILFALGIAALWLVHQPMVMKAAF